MNEATGHFERNTKKMYGCNIFSADKLAVQTVGPPNFQMLWVTAVRSSFFTFNIQACSDVWLGLSTLPGGNDEIIYKIVINPGGTNGVELYAYGEV